VRYRIFYITKTATNTGLEKALAIPSIYLLVTLHSGIA